MLPSAAWDLPAVVSMVFHGVAGVPVVAPTRCKPLEPLDREDFLGEFFFDDLSRSLRQFRIPPPSSEFSGERIISQRWLNCIRGRETSVWRVFFFFSYDKSVLYRYIIYFIDSSWTFSEGTIYYKWWRSIMEKINAQWRLLREIKRNFRSTNRLSEIVEPVEREFSAFWIGQRRCTRGDKVWWFVGFETPLRWKRRLDFSRACARVVSRARSSRLYAHANAHHSTKARELT